MKLKEKYWHEFFVISICIKTLTGLVETVSGVVLLYMSPAAIMAVFEKLTRNEQLEDPRDFFLAYVHQYMHNINSATQIFAGLYILSHGLINLVLVAGLIKEKTWAYLIAIGVLISFMSYQLFKVAVNHSLPLAVLTVFDPFFVIIIWHEYNYLTRKLTGSIPSLRVLPKQS
jgi:uncharacterized membrane protein